MNCIRIRIFVLSGFVPSVNFSTELLSTFQKLLTKLVLRKRHHACTSLLYINTAPGSSPFSLSLPHPIVHILNKTTACLTISGYRYGSSHTSGVLSPRWRIPQSEPLQTPGPPVRRRWWWGRPHPSWSFASISVLEVLSSLASCLGDISSRLLFASSGGYENGNKPTQCTVFNIIPIKITIKSIQLTSYMPSQYGGCGKMLLCQRQHTVTDEHLATAEWGSTDEKPDNFKRNTVGVPLCVWPWHPELNP
jgi:hypothetical protein